MNKHDAEYNRLVNKILNEGVSKGDRTGTGTTSLFGQHIEFDISNSFPLLTTKKVFWKTCLKELLWFISGSDDTEDIRKQNVHIWDGNTNKEFIEKNNLKLEEYKIGQGYGYQWRYSGLPYHEYKNINKQDKKNKMKYIDQLELAIETIKTNPDSRRIIVDSWDPMAIVTGTVALPPCHLLYQFYVVDGKISCSVYQRSCDVFLGLPFNIASYAFLTYMIANITGLIPDRLIFNLGDVHIYDNHLDAIKLQFENPSHEEAKVIVKKKLENIDDVKLEDFEVQYKSNGMIKAKMAV
jgi:thymidylate synthase